MPWLIAKAEHNRQEVARAELSDRCIKTYFPLMKKGRDCFAYYFGDYFFVESISTWIDDVLHVRGVRDVLHYDVEEINNNEETKLIKKPFILSNRELWKEVKSHEDNGYIPLKRGLRRGQKVRVDVLNGYVGKLEEDEDLARSTMVARIDFMGKDTRVVISKRSAIAVD
jgi:hypothetical protein